MRIALRSSFLGCLAFLTMAGCRAAPSSSPTPNVTPDRLGALTAKARTAHQAGDHESEALALREVVDLLGIRGDSEQLKQARAQCVEAMVEAGDNTESFRLWTDLVKKDKANKEAGRMKERARKLMLQQAGELAEQVDRDLKANRPQAALCTAQASLALCREAGADAALLKRAEAALTKTEMALKLQSPSGKSAPPGAGKSPPER